MEANKSPCFQQITKTRQSQKQRKKREQDRLNLAQVLLISWILGTFTIVLIVYLLTKDPTVVVFWTSCAGLITIILPTLFQKKE